MVEESGSRPPVSEPIEPNKVRLRWPTPEPEDDAPAQYRHFHGLSGRSTVGW